LLEWAAQESRILITIDTDFGQLVFLEGQSHSGLIRLPDVASNERVAIIKDLIERFQKELESRAIITVRGGKIRISASLG
jgi:predicted nuclease of predicted toxin-antitoxin system